MGEAKQLSDLIHPNIIKMKEYTVDSQQLFLVLHYAKDGDLFAYLRDHPELAELDRLLLFYQICKGIKYFHG